MERGKLVVAIMGQDCEKTIGMCLESVKDADAIVFCDGGSQDNTLSIVNDNIPMSQERIIIKNKFKQDNPNAISEQKQFWLDYIKKTCNDWFCLYIDADEVCDNLDEFKRLMNEFEKSKDTIFSPKMRHLIGNLATEDATKQIHYVPNRFFRVDDDLYFSMNEHTFVKSDKRVEVCFPEGLIWHLGYLGGVWDVKKRYDGQMSRMTEGSHSKKFLDSWYRCHLFDQYPTNKFNPVELPKVILDYFGIDKDSLYFINRGLETKHFIDAIQWRNFFNPQTACEIGCGRGPRVFAMNNIGIPTMGYEMSDYAIKNDILGGGLEIRKQDITKDWNEEFKDCFDLVVAYDLLEHIKYEDLDKAINNIMKASQKYILISVPVINDPNLEVDKTHIIKENKEWWIKQFTDKGLKLIPTPEHFLYKEQVMIFEK